MKEIVAGKMCARVIERKKGRQRLWKEVGALWTSLKTGARGVK